MDDDNINSLLEYYHCPPGFCQCSKIEGSSEICSSVYSYDDENLQCVCDRQGLCSCRAYILCVVSYLVFVIENNYRLFMW